jgi:imidazolonepropionase-like amidohydrolase
MKQDRLSGSLQTGKNADLVILDANPLENIKNIRKVKHVIRSGVLYDPDALHRLAGFTKP